ncbi:MAG: hypothetical protein AB8B55_02950 [Mariniblastus sp.]
MNQASNTRRVAATNPETVLRGISPVGFDLSEVSIELNKADTGTFGQIIEVQAGVPQAIELHLNDGRVSGVQASVEQSGIKQSGIKQSGNEQASDGLGLETPTLRINPESTRSLEDEVVDVIESQIESSRQVQQLASRLKENEVELIRRTEQLESRIADWAKVEREHELLFEKRLNELAQQSSQVKCQQLHLMQLQNDIVKSHEATRAAIEKIVSECDSDVKTIAAMKSLKIELSGRFDFIARRWEHLYNLMQFQRDQEAIDKAS